MNELAQTPVAAPLVAEGITVRPEWIDSNGHMNIAWYVAAFDQALDRIYPELGFRPEELAAGNSSNFVAEMHITYKRELREGDPLRITTQLLGFDEKRCHFIQCMYHAADGYLAATDEWLFVHVDMETRRSTVMQPALQARLADVLAAHRHLPVPSEVGRSISLAPRRPG